MKKNKWLTLDIQTFAEGDTDTGEETPPEDVTLTQEELDKKIEAESDRKLQRALEKKQAEWESQLAEKLEAERKSAAEYAKMTEKEKEDAQLKKRLEELEKREKEINRRELLTQIESDLKENDLPLSFAPSLLTVEDNEQIKKTIASIKKDFTDAVDAAVKDKLKGTSPKAQVTANNGVTKESILNIKDSVERIKAIQDNPHLFN